jgi:beta-lactamase family protein
MFARTILAFIVFFSCSTPKAGAADAQAVVVCTHHLQAIARALREYQRDRGELPPHLADLYPRYLTDRALLLCPADRSSGSPGAATTALPISYFYTMSTDTVPGPLTPQLSPQPFNPRSTWRDYKRLQRLHFGDQVPVVGCYHHPGGTLNLTLSGKVYRGDWPVHPDTIAVFLNRMHEDLKARPTQFTRTWDLGAVVTLPNWEKIETASEVIQRTSALPMEFPPGAKWSYNQTGYMLLKLIIERVSGRSYGEFLAERIFTPLSMTATRVPAKRVDGSSDAPGAWRQAANGVLSAVTDLAKWDAALYSERLLKKASLEQMWTPTKLTDGSTTSYGLGWVLGDDHGHRFVGHGGGTQNWIIRFVDDHLTVVVLASALGADTHPMVDGLAAFFLPHQRPIQDTAPATTRWLREVLRQMSAGQADPAQFTSAAQGTLLPELKQVAAFYQSVGPLKSFRLIKRSQGEPQAIYRYRTVFGKTPWIQTFALTNEGKITEVAVGPVSPIRDRE